MKNFNQRIVKAKCSFIKIDMYFSIFADFEDCSRLDFRRLPGPVFDPPRRESLSGDECGLIFPNSGW